MEFIKMNIFFVFPIIMAAVFFIIWLKVILTVVKRFKKIAELAKNGDSELAELFTKPRRGFAKEITQARSKNDNSKIIKHLEQDQDNVCPRCGNVISNILSKKCHNCSYRFEK